MMRNRQITQAFLFTSAILGIGCAGHSHGGMPFESEPIVRVRIVYTMDEVHATPQSPLQLRTPDGKDLGSLAPTAPVTIFSRDGNVLVQDAQGLALANAPEVRLASSDKFGKLAIKDVPYGIGWWWQAKEDRSYEGQYEVRVNKAGHLDIIVTMEMEEYLRGVVPQEIGGDAPPEALKAQAIAARSETCDALLTRKYAGTDYDICADVECQAFSGAGSRTAATDAAVRDTRGEAMFVNERPIAAYYASNCGGYSENIENVWPSRSGSVQQFSGHPDDDGALHPDLTTDEAVREWLDGSQQVYCNPALTPGLPDWSKKNFRWERRITADDLAKRVATKQDIGRITAIRPGKRGVSGRLIDTTFVGEKGELRVESELAIRQIWDPPLKSALLVVDTVGSAERPDEFVVRGAGWGHGVGMCQTGAIGRAKAGQDYRAILAQYYRGAKVEHAYPVKTEETKP